MEALCVFVRLSAVRLKGQQAVPGMVHAAAHEECFRPELSAEFRPLQCLYAAYRRCQADDRPAFWSSSTGSGRFSTGPRAVIPSKVAVNEALARPEPTMVNSGGFHRPHRSRNAETG